MAPAWMGVGRSNPARSSAWSVGVESFRSANDVAVKARLSPARAKRESPASRGRASRTSGEAVQMARTFAAWARDRFSIGGIVLFREVPDLLSWLGIAVILLSCLLALVPPSPRTQPGIPV